MRLLTIKNDLGNRKLLKQKYFKRRIKQSLFLCGYINLKLENSPSKKYGKVFCYNYCNLTGRHGGILNYYGVSRSAFRELFNYKLLYSVKKASW